MERVFADVIRCRLWNEAILYLKLGQKSMISALIKREEDPKRHRKEGYVKMSADIGVKHLQAKNS